MRYFREILNTAALLMVFAGLFTLFFVLRDLRMGEPPNWGFAASSVLWFTPFAVLFATGRMFTAAFFTELIYGGSSAADRGYSKERAWAREGKARDAALALWLRHRMVGDVPGLWAILEMARFDPGIKDLAVLAANGLFASRLSKAERDHVGRQLQLVKVSEAREIYTHWR